MKPYHKGQIVGRGMLMGGVFLAAMAASCALLAPGLPFPEVPLVRDKIEYLARHGDEFDVLFLGSSRVHCQIMPSIFDRVAAENGAPVKSFNAGINGMGSPEDAYVLEEILRHPHRRLRWIFLESSRLSTALAGENTARFGYWHDTARLVLITRRLVGQTFELLADDPAARFPARYKICSAMLGRFWGHLRSWVTRAANVGRGADVLNDWVNAATREYVPGKTLGPLHDGWLIMDRNRAPMSGIELEQYQKACVDRLTEPARQERGDPVSQSALEQLLGAVSKSGAQSVLFIPPTPSAHNFFPTAERERALTILDFSDVRQNAALFVPEHRLDIDHLNTAGAELFSRMLALRFAELAKGGSSKP